MPKTISVSQTNKLGDALRKHPPSDENIRLLHQIKSEYELSMHEAVRVLREELNLEASFRLKTNTTIIEKLRREKARLSSMRDIAGLRLVTASLEEQDNLVARISSQKNQIMGIAQST
jgi:ppGpp synthetase/RelA/SpoT-type nucleotidyltranferase